MPEQSQKALKVLLDHLRKFSAAMIGSTGRLYPCAVTLRNDRVEPIFAYDHDLGKLIEVLEGRSRSAVDTGGFEAAAMAVDVWLDDDHEKDGIQITVFTKDMPNIRLLMGWSRTESGVEYGKIRVLDSDPSDHESPFGN